MWIKTKLREYQNHAMWATIDALETNPHQLIVMPTGAGKTVLFAKIAEEQIKRGDRVLVLAHRAELVDQAADKIFAATGLVAGVEMGDLHASLHSDLVVASVQSMERRLDKWPRDHFNLIIVDEAHHVVADSWQRVINHWPNAKRIGVTATPDRSDARSLSTVFSHVAAEIQMLDLIRDGYLCQVYARKLEVKVDLRQLKKEISEEQAAEALLPHLQAVAAQLVEQAVGRKTMVFLPTVEISRKFAFHLLGLGASARHIHGDSDQRDETLLWFKKPGSQILCNAMLLTEGFDQPDVSCILVLRPTQSRALYAQMVGRGMRTAHGKADLLLLDPLWLTGKHNLCQPAELVTGSPALAKATQLNMDAGMDLTEAEAQARQSAEETLTNKLKRCAKLKTPRGLVNPFLLTLALGGAIADHEPCFPWESLPAEEADLQALTRAGFHITPDLTAGLAKKLIKRIELRRAQSLATPKQLQMLYRLRVKDADLLTVGQAYNIINNRIPLKR